VALDDELRRLIAEGSHHAAATRAFEVFGPELYGFLVHTMGNESDAAEVFSEVGENVWSALPKFGFRCSARTWLYVLTRHAAARFRRSPWNHRGRRAGESQISDAIDRVRTATAPWLRTDIKDRFRALRDELDPDDRELLVLRVDRDLSWDDVARVMLACGLARGAVGMLQRARLRLLQATRTSPGNVAMPV